MLRRLTNVGVAAAIVTLAATPVAFGPAAANADEPEITSLYPADGAVLAEPPVLLQMCVAAPINTKDLPPIDEGDYRMTIVRPDGSPAGYTLNFQSDGYGLTIRPNSEGAPEGEWTWTYRVVDAESGDELEGEVTFVTSAADGEEPVEVSPDQCLAEGAEDGSSESDPGSVDRPGAGSSAEDDPDTSEDQDDDPSVLEMALMTVAVASAAAVVGMLGYVLRKRVGYEPHASKGDDSPDDHH
jgi:hypothetical protein